jgi:hypothetical protein
MMKCAKVTIKEETKYVPFYCVRCIHALKSYKDDLCFECLATNFSEFEERSLNEKHTK